MSEIDTIESLPAIDRAVEKLVTALEQIATEHGSEAVDLAMTAYQIDSIQYLMFSAAAVLPGVFSIRMWRAGFREFRREGSGPEDFMPYFCIATLLAIPTIAGIGSALNPARWLAAFGNPEILVATNVLKSAGLL